MEDISADEETEQAGDAADTAAEEAETLVSSLPKEQLVQAGVNVKMGLGYCCGEEEFYLEMLRMFCAQSEEKREELIALYESENWADYAVKAHALKSTSLTIGAETLSAHAKTLELAGKSGDIEYIRENHSILLRMYEEVCGNIHDYITL